MPAYLFTDLESSTRLWEEHPDAMASALARHDTILHSAIAASGGTLVKSTGDGLLAVFDSSDAAVAAAIRSQADLGDEPWSIGPLRVRMGIHVGPGEARDGDWFGPAVNRAARIMAAAHGGQVLLSADAAVAAHLSESIALRDLGTHRLKDLTLPERLHQVLAPGLTTDFPAPATLDARPNNLPSQPSEFLGREEEVADVTALLDSPGVRLVTLTGPGGTGKTRLALQVAAERIDRHPDGVFFVDLSGESTADAAFEVVANVVDLHAAGAGHPLARLKAGLRDKHMLVVLDNLEQVTSMAGGLGELIASCPMLGVLVTSREALRIRSEHRFPVPPLGIPDPAGSVAEITASESVALFVDRALAVAPDFRLTDAIAPAVAEICRRLDGLPLAIELAAARLTLFSPADLLERLDRRLDVLASSHRDLPDRQRTLLGAIEWSYELLDPDECRMFEMLSVFSPTGLAAIEGVGERLGSMQVIEVLSSLVEKSLVRSEDGGASRRFSMLHTIREYAAARLAESDRRDEVRREHADWFARFVLERGDDLAGVDRAVARDALVSDIENIRTSWRYWVEQRDADRVLALVEPLWALHDAAGWYLTAVAITDDALSVIGPDHPDEELTLRIRQARALMAADGYSPAVEVAYRRVVDAGMAADPSHRLAALRPLATYFLTTMDFETAARLGRDLLDLGEQSGDLQARIDGHYMVGAAVAFGGDMPAGVPDLDRAVELFGDGSHTSPRLRLGPGSGVTALVASGLLRYQMGDFEEGISRVERALEVSRAASHPLGIAYGLWHNGLLDVYRARFESSRRRAVELGGCARDHDYPVWTTLAQVLEGLSLAGLGRADEGVTLTETGVELYRDLTTPPIFWPNLLMLRATVFALADDAARALELIDEAIVLMGPGVGPEYHLTRGDILLQYGDAAGAEQAFHACRSAARESGLRLLELMALTRLTRLEAIDGGGAARDELRALFESLPVADAEHDMQQAAAVLGNPTGD